MLDAARAGGAKARVERVAGAVSVGQAEQAQYALRHSYAPLRVAALTGFADAGAAVTQLSDYLLDTLEHETLVVQ